MKIEAKRSVVEIHDDDDEDFFSQVAAAEAAALASSKRRRVTPSLSAGIRSPLTNISNSKKEISAADEGLYMAALKGNQSLVRQTTAAKGNDAVPGGGGGGGGDSCFKCGKSGHWARDCDSSAGGGGGGGGNFGNSDTSIPEKSCPCGLGICTVLTANTEKNRGRKFYRCPLRQESGGCGFFEWCDNASAGNNYSMAGGNGNYTSDASFPGLPCPCGAGLCLILTAKTGKNVGQQFYKCPENQGSSCGFFKWCNENTTSVGAPVFYNSNDANNRSYSVRTGSSFNNSSDTNNTSYGVRTGSSCFKCGKEGHWARDCSAPLSTPPAEMGGRSASSGTCYKCGKPGHWSRDCSFS